LDGGRVGVGVGVRVFLAVVMSGRLTGRNRQEREKDEKYGDEEINKKQSYVSIDSPLVSRE
jgi:hypothetical protein